MSKVWWIKIRTELYAQPEVSVMAQALNVSVNEIVGRLARFWGWAVNATRSGFYVSTAASAFSAPLGGAPFFEAMERVGWLKRDARGDYQIPLFKKYMTTQSDSKARLKSERNARYRARKRLAGKGAAVVAQTTFIEPPEKALGEALEKARGRRAEGALREEKRREDSPEPPPGVEGGKPKRARKKELPAIPAALDTPEFRQAWAEWVEDREERKKPVTTLSAKIAFNKMLPWGVQRAVAAIRLSIESHWQGVYEGRGAAEADGKGKSLFDQPGPPSDEARRRKVYEEMAARKRGGA